MSNDGSFMSKGDMTLLLLELRTILRLSCTLRYYYYSIITHCTQVRYFYFILLCSVKTRLCCNCFLHTKHMCFGHNCFIVGSRHYIDNGQCCGEFRCSGHLLLHWKPMVISAKRFERRNCAYHRRSHLVSCCHGCCGECRCLINSLLHRKHIAFGQELTKRRHCSYHRWSHLLSSITVVCCGERWCLINSRHHRKHMCFGQELIKGQRSPWHRCCAQTRQWCNCFLHRKHMCFGHNCFTVASRHCIIIFTQVLRVLLFVL
jgi:hypothetical protein